MQAARKTSLLQCTLWPQRQREMPPHPVSRMPTDDAGARVVSRLMARRLYNWIDTLLDEPWIVGIEWMAAIPAALIALAGSRHSHHRPSGAA